MYINTYEYMYINTYKYILPICVAGVCGATQVPTAVAGAGRLPLRHGRGILPRACQCGVHGRCVGLRGRSWPVHTL